MKILFILLSFGICMQLHAQMNTGMSERNTFPGSHEMAKTTSAAKQHPLKLYPALVYFMMRLHPKSGSHFEKQTFKHYLNGTASTFYMNAEEFERIAVYVQTNFSTVVFPLQDSAGSDYYTAKVSLYGLPYFDNSLGMVVMYFDKKTNKPFALYDVFNFNKAKIGARKLKHEIQTRLVHMVQPKRAKEFVICYSCEEVNKNN